MDIFNNLINILSDTQFVSLGTQSDATVIDESINNMEELVVPEKFRTDVEVLKKLYPGIFIEGQGVIVLTLTEALDILPRVRRRSDAYHYLQEWLKEKGITLTIKSRKSR